MGALSHKADGWCVRLSQLPPDLRARLRPTPVAEPDPSPLLPVPPSLDAEASLQAEAYAEAANFNRRICDMNTSLLNECTGLNGQALKEFVERKRQEDPTVKISVKKIYRLRKNATNGGTAELLGGYGKRRGFSIVPDEPFDYFKRLYLTEGRPSENSCYMYTVGWAKKRGYDVSRLPKAAAFVRRLKSEVPEHAVFRARHGAAAANRKYGFYIKRDFSDVLSGECWVSDHMQLDVAVTCKVEGREKTVFPWLTVMRDFKSGRWVGWYLHAEAPNSNHIFMAFYRAASAHGIPSYLYLDNGKDYRCIDFAGGRRSVKLEIDEMRTTSMCASLGITVIYAIPYNAQSKPVERDFLLLKEWFSKHNVGYRGGNVVERPESLNDKIKAGKIMAIEEIEKHIDTFVDSVTSLPLAASDWRNGKSELDLWEAEYPTAVRRGIVKQVTDKALAMFCCRTSRVMTVGRRGIHDSELGVDYYEVWMEGQKGRKVYLRRDPKAMEVAWVFDAQTDELINKAYLLPTTPALARTDIQKEMLEQSMAIKRRSNKILKVLANAGEDIPFDEKMDNLAEYAKLMRGKADSGETSAMPEPTLLITNMDIDLAEQAKREKEGAQDLSILGLDKVEVSKKASTLYNFEWERDEALGGLAAG